MIRTYKKSWDALSKEVIKDLKKMTMPTGIMKFHIEDQNAIPYIAAQSGEILGWAMYHAKGSYHRETWIFVPCKNRRKGVGTKLMNRIIKDQGKCIVIPWNKASRRFFDKLKPQSKLQKEEGW